MLLIAGALIWLVGSQVVADPGEPGPCTVASQTVNINGALETDVYYPITDTCPITITAPYPAVAFAHGFSMFGFSDGRAENVGNGEHLASWGYVVAIPDLPDGAEERITDTLTALSYLETETGTPGSFLYQQVDTDRLATAGHSLGGATALAVAARDARVKAVVALDPVYHTGGPTGGDPIWDPETEAPNITVPTGILGAPPSDCNADADYADIYPLVGATHKASYLVVGASHCDFTDPGNSFCYTFCGGGSTNITRTQLSQSYMTAWFNYYLYLNTDHYTHLYGDELDVDVQADLIIATVQTAPRDVAATGQFGAVELTWTLYDHPIIAGYNIYRSLQSGDYSDVPYAQVGTESSYTDAGVVPAQEYFYVLRSRDPAGNEHQISAEVSATPQGMPALLSPPNGTVTATQAITFVWQAGAGPPPDGYNLNLDGTVITTTGTTSATVLSLGVHTWTVRAYNATGYSDWVTPAWTVQVVETLPSPGVPTLLAPPDSTVTTTQVITFAWAASAGASPAGYNLQVDGHIITTTDTTSATILSLGVHTWTVRAYNGVGYSDWVTPAWTVQVTDTLPPPGVPTLLAPPDGAVTTTQAITFTWAASAGASPTGYNFELDGLIITTTNTFSATVLSAGIHTWTVRAYNVIGASAWATPRTLTIHHHQIYLSLVVKGTTLSTGRRQ